MVFLQSRFLAVGVVAFRAPDHGRILGPGFVYTHAAKVVLAWQLNRLRKHMQTDRAYELFFQTVLPGFSHFGCQLV